MKYLSLLFPILICFCGFNQEFTKNVYFDVDEYDLTEESKQTLDELIPTIKNRNIQITGYTDSTGGITYNQRLSKKRAKTVSDYLASNGINSDNMKPILAKGESTSETSFDKNRKVSIAVYNENPISSDISDDDNHLSKTKDEGLNEETIKEIKVGDILNIGGLEFHPGRHFLKPYSMPVLDELTNVLLDNPEVKIEIQGHICCQPSGDGLDTDTGTRNLSENRAKQVYNELVERGVSSERLTHKGYGANRKLEEEVNPTAMQRNRRVSILIIEK